MEEDILCPICNERGVGVKNTAVKHLIINKLADEIDDENYFICRNEECDTVYFNTDKTKIYDKKQVKVPIWFKKDANPKYICYCNQVTEEEIIEAVANDGGKNMKDIIRITGAMKNAKCELKNPLGKCCGPIIQEIINKTLADKN